MTCEFTRGYIVSIMEALRLYLNSLPLPEQADFARRCGTTIGYLRKAISRGQQFSTPLTVAIERESNGAVRVESICPAASWDVIRRPADHPGEAA